MRSTASWPRIAACRRLRDLRRLDEAAQPELVVATRGLSRSTSRSCERDLHSGHYGGTALNAIHALAQALTALFPSNGRLPEPLRASVTPPSEEELAGWSELPAGRRSSNAWCGPFDAAGEEFYLRAFVEPSLDVTGILGGSPGSGTRRSCRRVGGRHGPRRPRPGPEVLAAAAEALLREALPDGRDARDRVRPGPPALLPRDTEALRLARATLASSSRPPLVVRAGGTLPILAALGGPRDSDRDGRARAPGQPHALAERADAARDVPARCRGRPRDVPRLGASVPAAGQPERRVDEPDVAVRLREVAALLERVAGRMSSE